MATLKSFEDLDVWRKAIDLTEAIYRASGNWPSEERYGLTQQVRRAAASVAVNIAERAERNSTKDFLRFLGISKGSLAETKTFLIIAERLAYLDRETSVSLRDRTDEIGRMLSGLSKSLQTRL